MRLYQVVALTAFGVVLFCDDFGKCLFDCSEDAELLKLKLVERNLCDPARTKIVEHRIDVHGT